MKNNDFQAFDLEPQKTENILCLILKVIENIKLIFYVADNILADPFYSLLLNASFLKKSLSSDIDGKWKKKKIENGRKC